MEFDAPLPDKPLTPGELTKSQAQERMRNRGPRTLKDRLKAIKAPQNILDAFQSGMDSCLEYNMGEEEPWLVHPYERGEIFKEWLRRQEATIEENRS